jgi:GTPase Era involved in 16S rRNA processing
LRLVIPLAVDAGKELYKFTVDKLVNIFKGSRKQSGRHSVLIIGIAGSGKSTLSNFILGRPGFEMSSLEDSKTKNIQALTCKRGDTEFEIIDTEGLLDTGGDSVESTIKKILKSLYERDMREVDHIFMVFDAENMRANAQKLESYAKLIRTFRIYEYRNQMTFILRQKGDVSQIDRQNDAKVIQRRFGNAINDEKWVLSLTLLDEDDRVPTIANFESVLKRNAEKRDVILDIICNSIAKKTPIKIEKYCWSGIRVDEKPDDKDSTN